ncbi:MAG: exosortase A-associated hydrolase 2 [Bacteroidia bacterium]|jgi:exosortase A-associated hydrolase 2
MNSRKFEISADFLEVQGRRLFYLLLTPNEQKIRGSVLYLPPFAEEMQLSRRSVSVQARLLAEVGYCVMLLDLTGCGDAAGEFIDASWEKWLGDVHGAADHLLSLSGSESLNLWGLRLGGLLAAQVAVERSDISRLLLWQPVLNGEQQVDQFLRLQVAADVLAGDVNIVRSDLWGKLRDGESLEIAGYDLTPDLALPMSGVRLATLLPSCPVEWFEVAAVAATELSVAGQRSATRWREEGVDVRTKRLVGEPFWRNLDASASSQLLESTLAAMEQVS